jgi:hypothetical protein
LARLAGADASVAATTTLAARPSAATATNIRRAGGFASEVAPMPPIASAAPRLRSGSRLPSASPYSIIAGRCTSMGLLWFVSSHQCQSNGRMLPQKRPEGFESALIRR